MQKRSKPESQYTISFAFTRSGVAGRLCLLGTIAFGQPPTDGFACFLVVRPGVLFVFYCEVGSCTLTLASLCRPIPAISVGFC
jgi:hypothetical protein